MPVPSPKPAVAPVLVAALLLVAISFLTALGLPRPTAAAVLEKTGAGKTRAYELAARVLAILPALLSPPGRPPAPPPPKTDTGAISREIIAFIKAHPGSSMRIGTRNTYSDGFRHRVVELVEQHPDLDITQLAEAVGVPTATVQDWLAGPAPAPAIPKVDPDLDAATHARIASIVVAWGQWAGGFSAFCRFVRHQLAIDYRTALIRRILATHAGRRPVRRSGRSPDEKATRKALRMFFSGAQWFQDGSPISITLNGAKFTFNWELGADGYSGALVGTSLRSEEDAAAVVEAFGDGVATTGAPPLALTTDNYAANHAPEVAGALGEDTIHIRTTLGRPQTDAPVEGAFGLFRQTAPPLVISGKSEEELARAILAMVLTIWCRATNHRPRNDRNGRSRVQLYQGEQATDEQILAAKAQLEERRRRQELAFRTRQARLDPVVRALLDEAFGRLGFDDPTGNVKDAIARYPHDAVLAGIATFEGKHNAGTLPTDAGPRYLLGIVHHITERDEGLAIAEQLWQRRLEAGDRALVRLDEARRNTLGTAIERVRAFVDRALAEDGPLLRGFWLAAAGDVLLEEPRPVRRALYDSAVRRICGTFRVHPRERQAAVRVIAAHVLAIA